jgi:hypothetical protein
MQLPSNAAVQQLEASVQHSLRTLNTDGLTILGYGEITTVFRLDADEGAFACKRFPVFRSAADACNHQALIERYIAALTGRGLRVLESGFVPLENDGGTTVLYLVQPILDPKRIGPVYFKSLTPEAAGDAYRAILHAVRNCISESLAPDGQLSNWAFLDEGLTYMDISTPFMRSESGDELCDWAMLTESVLSGLLAPARGYFVKKAPETVASYYTLRGQAVDFLGNLRKEGLGELIEPFIPIANEVFELDPPVTLDDVKKYYNDDADFYALLMRLMRINRFFYRHVLRKTYPNFIAPPIERNKF